MKLNNRTKGNADVKIFFKCTKEIKHKILYNVIMHVDELTKRGAEAEMNSLKDFLNE